MLQNNQKFLVYFSAIFSIYLIFCGFDLTLLNTLEDLSGIFVFLFIILILRDKLIKDISTNRFFGKIHTLNIDSFYFLFSFSLFGLLLMDLLRVNQLSNLWAQIPFYSLVSIFIHEVQKNLRGNNDWIINN